MLMILLAAVALQDAGSAPPASQVIENPRWIRYPEVNFNRSTRDRSGGAPEGRVVLRCIATVEGRLEDCTVVSDTSVSNRLSPYALRAARTAEIRPRTIDGQPVATDITFSVGVAPAN